MKYFIYLLTLLIIIPEAMATYLLQDDSPCINAGEVVEEVPYNNFLFEDLRTWAMVDGVQKRVKCPVWDWSLVPEECRFPTFNCIPRCGKYPGDKPDIGAMEWFPGQTPEKPWGDWTGVPLTDFPEGAPESPTLQIIPE